MRYINRLLVPQRINSIRYVDCAWWANNAPTKGSRKHREWVKIWEAFASLDALDILSVRINIISSWRDAWRHNEGWLLKDLKLVTRPRTFTLSLSWPEGDVPIESLQLSCDVTRLLVF